jgi:hypothetical protein
MSTIKDMDVLFSSVPQLLELIRNGILNRISNSIAYTNIMIGILKLVDFLKFEN